MRCWKTVVGLAIACLVSLAVPTAQALGPSGDAAGDEVAGLVERGRQTYLTHCGACHGVEGKGDGSVADYLTVKPPDLAGISARAEGDFPFDEIYDVVDGREVAGHGTRAMPVWGAAFKGLDPDADKRAIKEKVVEVVYYLKSIQPALPMTHPKMGGKQE